MLPLVLIWLALPSDMVGTSSSDVVTLLLIMIGLPVGTNASYIVGTSFSFMVDTAANVADDKNGFQN